MSVSCVVPFTKPHGSILDGQNGTSIAQLQEQFGCTITMVNHPKSSGGECQPIIPFFNIEGSDELQVNRVALKIFTLLNASMSRSEKALTHETLLFKKAYEEQSKLHILKVDEMTKQILELMCR